MTELSVVFFVVLILLSKSMYVNYFGLKEPPFSISPDPRFLYLSEQHQEALAHLVYGITTDAGFVLLTGEVGTGKTTICRRLLEQIPEKTDIAFILNPRVTPEELLAAICDELRIQYPANNSSIKVFVDAINAHLLESHGQGRKTIVIIEEAQNLTANVMEQLRLLTNLETDERKLLQIVLIGQPELRDILKRPNLRQLSQRITARFHLGPLSRDDVLPYVVHRLSVAGVNREIFLAATADVLYRWSQGIPRLINIICDRAILGAYVQNKAYVDRETLTEAAEEVLGPADDVRPLLTRPRFAFLLVFLIFSFTAALAMHYHIYQKQPLASLITFLQDDSPLPKQPPWVELLVIRFNENNKREKILFATEIQRSVRNGKSFDAVRREFAGEVSIRNIPVAELPGWVMEKYLSLRSNETSDILWTDEGFIVMRKTGDNNQSTSLNVGTETFAKSYFMRALGSHY